MVYFGSLCVAPVSVFSSCSARSFGHRSFLSDILEICDIFNYYATYFLTAKFYVRYGSPKWVMFLGSLTYRLSIYLAQSLSFCVSVY
jgi:hypothetical protein